MVIVFSNGYNWAYFPFILNLKRSISVGIERKNNLERFETSRLNSMGTFSRSEIAHVVLWIHGSAVHRDFYYDSSLGNRLALRARYDII